MRLTVCAVFQPMADVKTTMITGNRTFPNAQYLLGECQRQPRRLDKCGSLASRDLADIVRRNMLCQPHIVAGDKKLMARGVHLCGLNEEQYRLAVPHGNLNHGLLVRGQVHVVTSSLKQPLFQD